MGYCAYALSAQTANIANDNIKVLFIAGYYCRFLYAGMAGHIIGYAVKYLLIRIAVSIRFFQHSIKYCLKQRLPPVGLYSLHCGFALVNRRLLAAAIYYKCYMMGGALSEYDKIV